MYHFAAFGKLEDWNDHPIVRPALLKLTMDTTDREFDGKHSSGIYFHPFHDLPLISSHIHLFYAVYNAGRKLVQLGTAQGRSKSIPEHLMPHALLINEIYQAWVADIPPSAASGLSGLPVVLETPTHTVSKRRSLRLLPPPSTTDDTGATASTSHIGHDVGSMGASSSGLRQSRRDGHGTVEMTGGAHSYSASGSRAGGSSTAYSAVSKEEKPRKKKAVNQRTQSNYSESASATVAGSSTGRSVLAGKIGRLGGKIKDRMRKKEVPKSPKRNATQALLDDSSDDR